MFLRRSKFRQAKARKVKVSNRENLSEIGIRGGKISRLH